MGAFVNNRLTTILACCCAIGIILLNVYLLTHIGSS
jgi:Mn2+/Fe2+ NRAMP family transporter